MKNKQAFLEDGRTIDYDRLLLATGAEPRRLNAVGSDTSVLHYLRTADDACRINQALQPEP
jgi:3-phenylpropionate/trans-cinnamate dioxygenase ferredoxin reductase subunit